MGSISNGNLGYSGSLVGDLNKDGYEDIIVGAYGENNYTGAAYVIFGGSTPSNIYVGETMSSSQGFKITGSTISSDFAGVLSSGGDVNNDGFIDLVISAPLEGSETGAVYIITPIICAADQHIDMPTFQCSCNLSDYIIFEDICICKLFYSNITSYKLV